MPKLITGIPPDKMKSFSRSLSPSDQHDVSMLSHQARKRNIYFKPSIPHLRKIASSFILFDWEFFSNELEYE
jgi:hypothetical protein